MTPKFQSSGFTVEDPNRSETKERMADLKQCAETFDSIVWGYSSSFVCSILSDNKQSVLPWCHVSFEGCCSLKKIIACIRWVVLWTWQRSCPFTAAVFFLAKYNIPQFRYPLYSPHLARRYFFFFLSIKLYLKVTIYQNVQEIQENAPCICLLSVKRNSRNAYSN